MYVVVSPGGKVNNISQRRRTRDIQLLIIGATGLFSLGGCSKAPPDMQQSLYKTKQDCLMHWGHVDGACRRAEGEYARKDYYVGAPYDANDKKEKPRDTNGVVATMAPALIAGAAAAAVGAAALAAQQQQQQSSSTSSAVYRTSSSAAPESASSAKSTSGGFGTTGAHSSSSGG
jgi:uncharacterized protein YgiB involved in biofilm formation